MPFWPWHPVSAGGERDCGEKLYSRYPQVDLLSHHRQMVYAAIIMTVVALLVPQRTIDWQPYVFWALSYSAILATAVARSLWLFVLRKLPAGLPV